MLALSSNDEMYPCECICPLILLGIICSRPWLEYCEAIIGATIIELLKCLYCVPQLMPHSLPVFVTSESGGSRNVQKCSEKASGSYEMSSTNRVMVACWSGIRYIDSKKKELIEEKLFFVEALIFEHTCTCHYVWWALIHQIMSVFLFVCLSINGPKFRLD